MSTEHKPFFSIILPTKNRSEILNTAIYSVINQTFNDWELVIIDNDDSEDTHAVVSKHQDERIQYYRTGGLPMWDNWEVGFQKAEGEYILVLEDKMALKQNSLEFLCRAIESNEPEVVSWKYDITHNAHGADFKVDVNNSDVQWLESKILLDDFVINVNQPFFWSHAPRGMNSCISRKTLKKIQILTGKLCHQYAPDFTMAYQQLLAVPKILYISSPLVSIFSSKVAHSNGISVFTRKIKNVCSYFGVTGEKELVKNVDIKVCTPINGVLSDFFSIAARYNISCSYHDIEPVAYFTAINRELLRSKYEFGASVKQELLEWEKALLQRKLNRRTVGEIRRRSKENEAILKQKKSQKTRWRKIRNNLKRAGKICLGRYRG
jgi:glycosyltransferase involved in cell wall biosynthesis